MHRSWLTRGMTSFILAWGEHPQRCIEQLARSFRAWCESTHRGRSCETADSSWLSRLSAHPSFSPLFFLSFLDSPEKQHTQAHFITSPPSPLNLEGRCTSGRYPLSTSTDRSEAETLNTCAPPPYRKNSCPSGQLLCQCPGSILRDLLSVHHSIHFLYTGCRSPDPRLSGFPRTPARSPLSSALSQSHPG